MQPDKLPLEHFDRFSESLGHPNGNSQTEDCIRRTEFRRNHSLEDAARRERSAVRGDRLLGMNKVSKQISPSERMSFAASGFAVVN